MREAGGNQGAFQRMRSVLWFPQDLREAQRWFEARSSEDFEFNRHLGVFHLREENSSLFP